MDMESRSKKARRSESVAARSSSSLFIDMESRSKKARRSESVAARSSSSLFIDMESRSKKARRSESVAARSHVPPDILLSNILPRLSFKSLTRFESVCKSWRALITEDSLFAADQSLHPSPASSGFVYLGSSGLEFLSAPGTPVGVPRPSLEIPFHAYSLKLVASTNGLLCCLIRAPASNFFNDGGPCFNLLYVLNPATRESHLVPAAQSHSSFFIGLAFDPSNSPSRYALVCLRRCHGVIEGCLKTQHWFHVFSSETREWVVSSQTVLVDDFVSGEPTAVFAGGVLYWDCISYLIWFDPSKDLAGRTPLPEDPSSAGVHWIGVWEGRVTCTQAWDGEVEVFVMTNGNGSSGNWVRRHRASFEAMVGGNPEVFAKFCHPMRLRSGRLWDRLISRWFLRPLALDGGDKLYIALKPIAWMPNEKERVLCYDLRTGEMTSISDGIRLIPFEDRVFSYHNSMVRLPELCSEAVNTTTS
ncbi:F-box protein At5g07610-like isoform X2 [Phoenix dactylifera]|nr:F-box protein At5g07610-like isoform X2 [Phoenix dactylifera]